MEMVNIYAARLPFANSASVSFKDTLIRQYTERVRYIYPASIALLKHAEAGLAIVQRYNHPPPEGLLSRGWLSCRHDIQWRTEGAVGGDSPRAALSNGAALSQRGGKKCKIDGKRREKVKFRVKDKKVVENFGSGKMGW